ncbi:hypothetical protein VTO42DRAFT_3312 [Malbranchea cinnamomea]
MSPLHRSIDLDLDSRWFAKKPPKFPYPALRKVGSILSATYSWECDEVIQPIPGTEWTFIGAVQWEDDPRTVTKIRVRWNSSNISMTVKGDYKHVSVTAQGEQAGDEGAQRKLNANELQLATEWYGKHVFAFCEENLGFVVGDGECWTLAQQALQEAGRRAIAEGHDPPMVSMGRVHGQCILEWKADSKTDVRQVLAFARPAAGDIMEMDGAKFRKHRTVMGILNEMTNVRMGKHTAIVDCVRANGSKIAVIEQNTKMESRVTRGEYELADMVAGKIKIYRPIGQSTYSPLTVNLAKMCESW